MQNYKENFSTLNQTIFKKDKIPWPSEMYLRSQDWFDIQESIDAIHHINKLKQEILWSSQ